MLCKDPLDCSDGVLYSFTPAWHLSSEIKTLWKVPCRTSALRRRVSPQNGQSPLWTQQSIPWRRWSLQGEENIITKQRKGQTTRPSKCLDHNFFVANAWITTSSSALIPQAIHLSFSLKVIHWRSQKALSFSGQGRDCKSSFGAFG
jgi:hypothetical protein